MVSGVLRKKGKDCGSRNTMMPARETRSVGRLLELVSSEVGLIRSLSPVVRGAEEPSPPVIYQAMLSHFDFRVAKDWERVGVGKGSTRTEAMLGAIGEAVEHYCASHFDEQRTLRAPWATVAERAIAPSAFVLYSEKQYAGREFPYHRWNKEQLVRWLPMTELPDGGGGDVAAPPAYFSLGGDTPPGVFFLRT